MSCSTVGFHAASAIGVAAAVFFNLLYYSLTEWNTWTVELEIYPKIIDERSEIMGTNLYFVSDGSASEMAEYRYDTEDELQKLIVCIKA